MDKCLSLYFFRISLVFVSAMIWTLGSSSSSDEETKSLYSNDDPILQLSVSDFNQSIYMKNKAFFIEFYSSWCGHCIHFAPMYKEFSRSVSKWNDIVEVGAINCALDTNLPMCQDQGVEAYPTIKYYKYLSRGPDAGQFYEHAKQTVDDLVSGTAQMVFEDWRKHMPSGWPNLTPLKDDASDAQVREDNSDTPFSAIVVEPANRTFVGVQLALDFHADRSKVIVKSVGDKSLMAQTHNIKHYPGLIILKKNDPTAFYISKSIMTRQDMSTKIRYHAGLGSESKKGDASMTSIDKELISDQKSDDGQFVHKIDLVSSISYMFYHEIAKFKIISTEKLSDLKQFLETLSRYFPGNDAEKRFLFRLISFLNEIRSEISSAEWKMQLNLLQRQFGNPWTKNVTWVSCKGSKSKFRGFPCSLWSLFHVLTVNAFKMDGKKKTFEPVEVLKSIKSYVRSFFGCKECADNFQKESEDLHGEAKKPVDVVIWLWRLHNKVNQRLKGQLSEDPEHPKIQFPSEEICPSCFNSEKGSWNENEVLNFLIKFYTDLKTGPSKWAISKTMSVDENDQNPIDDGRLELNPRFKIGEKRKDLDENENQERKQLLNRLISTNESENLNISANFNNFDFSLCFILWMFSAAAIVILFIFLKVKRTRHKFVKNFYSNFKV